MGTIKDSIDAGITEKFLKLKGGQIGTLDLVILVIACAAPMTIVAGVMPAMFGTGGIGTPAAYIFAGVVYGFAIVGYIAMARHIEDPGAFYAFVTVGFGERTGGTVGMISLMSYLLISIAEIVACGAFGQTALLYIFGINVPWWLIAGLSGVVIAWLGYRQVSVSAKVLGVALFLEMTFLLIFAFVTLSAGGADGIRFDSFTPTYALTPGTGTALMFAFASFFGIEATAIYSEESRNPTKTVPRATYLSVAILTVFYTLLCWVVVLAFGNKNISEIAIKHADDMIFIAAQNYVGTYITGVMHALLYTSIFASALAFFNQANRYMLSLGRAKVLPTFFAAMHEGHQTPINATIVQFLIAIALIIAFTIAKIDPYSGFLTTASPGIIGIVVAQLSASLSVLLFFRKKRWKDVTLWHRMIAPIIGSSGLIVAVVLMVYNFNLFTGAGTIKNLLLFVPMIAAVIWGLSHVGQGIRTYYDEHESF